MSRKINVPHDKIGLALSSEQKVMYFGRQAIGCARCLVDLAGEITSRIPVDVDLGFERVRYKVHVDGAG